MEIKDLIIGVIMGIAVDAFMVLIFFASRN